MQAPQISATEVAIQYLADRLMEVEKDLNELKQEIKKMREDEIKELTNTIHELDKRLRVREHANGVYQSEIADLEAKQTEFQKTLDSLRKIAWIMTGVIATIQFIAPIFVQMLFK